MGRSSPLRDAAGALVLGLLAAACAQVTGLADDYRYDLADGGRAADGGGGGGGDGGGTDGGDGGPAQQCTTVDRAKAELAMTNAAGDRLTTPCRSCLSTSCCLEIDRCAATADCNQSMRCIFNCQRETGGGNNKTQCLGNCGLEFLQLVGPCVEARCDAPTCALD
jgi:hypothetical protein